MPSHFLCKTDVPIKINTPAKHDALHEAVSSLIKENLETSGAPEQIDNWLSPPSFSDGDNSHETDYADLIGKIKVDGDDNIKEGKILIVHRRRKKIVLRKLRKLVSKHMMYC